MLYYYAVWNVKICLANLTHFGNLWQYFWMWPNFWHLFHWEVSLGRFTDCIFILLPSISWISFILLTPFPLLIVNMWTGSLIFFMFLLTNLFNILSTLIILYFLLVKVILYHFSTKWRTFCYYPDRAVRFVFNECQHIPLWFIKCTTLLHDSLSSRLILISLYTNNLDLTITPFLASMLYTYL